MFKSPITIDELSAASSQAVATRVDGDTNDRLLVDAGGKLTWGSGSAAGDTTLYRSAANILTTDDGFRANTLGVTSQYTLPSADGSASQILSTNGSGTISFGNTDLKSVKHDATAGTARAAAATRVIWIGTATPSNATSGDIWIDMN